MGDLKIVEVENTILQNANVKRTYIITYMPRFRV
jgi:hypothetical protein